MLSRRDGSLIPWFWVVCEVWLGVDMWIIEGLRTLRPSSPTHLKTLCSVLGDGCVELCLDVIVVQRILTIVLTHDLEVAADWGVVPF